MQRNYGGKVMNLTTKEREIIEWICDETEMQGFGDYIYFNEWDMNVYRGVIGSLIQKGACAIDEGCTNQKEGYMWLYLTDADLIKERESIKPTIQCNRQCDVNRKTLICESCGMDYNG